MSAMRWAGAGLIAGAVMLMGSLMDVPGARAQPAAPPLPDDCKSLGSETRLSLDARKAELDKKLVALRDRLADAPLLKRREAERDMRKAEEDMLELVFMLDCLRLTRLPPPPSVRPAEAPFKSRGLAQPAPPPPSAAPPAPSSAARPAPPPVTSAEPRGSGAAMERSAAPTPRAVVAESPAPANVEIVTYYATNRARGAANAAPGETYGSERTTDVSFGRVVVSIPREHTQGNIELPQLWKFERTPDPSKHFVLKSVNPLATDAARAEMASTLASKPESAVLVFVHGYNSSFEYAAMRTAQLSFDLQFKGVPFFFSWPSANRVRAYLQDEESAQLSYGAFETVLKELNKLPVESIYIVAHSMGNRVVGHGLERYVSNKGQTDRIKELLLAAPDINAEIFKEQIVPRLEQMRGTRTTIYASSSDLALMASKVVHGFRRVGESSGGVLVFKGMDTVDASNASGSLRNLGHSYLVDSTSVIGDLRAVIARKLAAGSRGLLPKGKDPESYWQLPQ